MAHLLYWTLLLGVVAAACGFRVSERDNEISLTVDDESSIEESFHEEFASSQEEDVVRPWFQCPPQQDGLFPNPRNCSTFMQCSNGVAHVMPCPKGLHYSAESERCEQPCDAYCNWTLSCTCKWSTCGLPQVCFLPGPTGSCPRYFPRYFFNKRSGECKKFIYGGCPGNANSFETKEACEKKCTKDKAPGSLKVSSAELPQVCSLPKAHGPCRSNIPRFFFDKSTTKCEKFVYGGCMGNENNFKSREVCERRCIKVGDESLIEESSHEQSWNEELESSQEENVRSWFKCPSQQDGLFPNPRNCSTFMQCSNGNAHVMLCPKGLHYSAETKRCEQPCDAYCNRTLSCKCKWPTCDLPRDCFLPKETGPCRGSIPRFFFNKRTGECEKFIYGGCAGNTNNFETKEACEKRCPKVPNVCHLPKEVGPCRGSIPRYFFNIRTEQCEKFLYGGCEGNSNNFETTEACEQRCIKVGDESLIEESSHEQSWNEELASSQEEDVRPWFQCPPQQDGLFPNPRNCSTFMQCSNGKAHVMPCPKGLHYSAETKRCEQPCDAYCNRNLSCTCKWPTCGLPRVCFLPKQTGPCHANLPRYFFNKRTGECEKFIYGGCRGSPNNFETKETCEKRCTKVGQPEEEISMADEKFESKFQCPPKNGLFPNPRNCSTFVQCSNGIANVMPCPEGLHYSMKTKRCEQPCKAFCNQTLSCECKWPTCGLPAMCFLPSKTGPCQASFRRWFFNKRTGKCEKFIYGGCRGNGNNFDTKESCQKICRKSVDESSIEEPREQSWNEETPTSAEVAEDTQIRYTCLEKDGLFKNPSNCNSYFKCSTWIPQLISCPENMHFSETTRRCESPCVACCSTTIACPLGSCDGPRVCSLPKETGPCHANFPRYFFNKNTGECEKFNYGGCQGNHNNFLTNEYCEHKCKNVHEELSATDEQLEPLFKCPSQENGLFPNPRNCSTFVQCSNGAAHVMPCPKGLHYSVETKRCEQPCDAYCNQTLSCKCKWPTCDLPRVCFLPKETGPCHASLPRYFFNKRTGECEKFIFGGCQGNQNNFVSKEVCEKRCTKVMLSVCQMPKLVGPCRGSIPRHFFNKRTEKCEKFLYGGCDGNANNFETIEACEQRCNTEHSD